MASPSGTQNIGVKKGEIGQKSNGESHELECPICHRDFPDTDTLVHHMTYHRSAKAKSKAGKPKRKGQVK